MQARADRPHVAVVGAGISGLAAAWLLRRAAGEAIEVTVLEGSTRIGGKLQVSEVAGIPVDEGADAILVRRPEGRDLVRAVGLAGELTEPGTTSASLWTRGRLRPLPAGTIMGVPADLSALARARILSDAGLARVPLDLLLPRISIEGDVSVGSYVGARLGREVVDRLVDPLLGGVYAGRADMLSLDATLPGLAPAAHAGRSLLLAAREAQRPSTAAAGPVFNTLTGGLGTLPPAVAAGSGARVRTSAMVRELRRTGGSSGRGWRLTVGETRAPESVEADAVVLAVPARPASRLLADEVPGAAAELAAIDYASVAVVTLAYNRSAFPAGVPGSGYLVPAVDGRTIKAVTFSTNKWPHLTRDAPQTVVVRCSIGAYREEGALHRSDQELAAVAVTELAQALAVRELPVDSRVTRWGGSLPQYAVGHLDRVSRARSAVAAVPGLAVCGAAYDGLGIPACVASARSAVTQVLGHLDPEGQWRHAEAPGPRAERADSLHDVVGLPGT
ncbi:MAG: protoporphyrinogen oxidase [Streptosporangiales bacterium]|nr:protoporphyrinogen oxidase [Streptosporangiales bacterium]